MTVSIDEAIQVAYAHHQAGRLQAAADIYLEILRADGDNAAALCLYGALAMQVGNVAVAYALLEKGVQLDPSNADAQNNFGAALKARNRADEAEFRFRKAISLNPNCAEAHDNLGVILFERGDFDAATASHELAVKLKPDYAQAHCHLGAVASDQGRFAESIAHYDKALELDPDFSEAVYNRSLSCLALGRYAEGWACYESRIVVEDKKVVMPDLPFPSWRGESLQGKSLLLWPEQGFGDYIQFIRYASLLKARGVSRLTVHCPAPLRDLLATADGVDAVISDRDEMQPHDYWSFPLSLPLHLGTTVDNIPASLPYLRALPSRMDSWRKRMAADGLKIGLVWKGSSIHGNDRNRSLPALSALSPLWGMPGISFVSLQKGAGEDEARGTDLPIIDLGSDIDDFADTAAIVDQLDLVICVDTAVAHVAGALGKPCWVLLPAIGCDWRWMRDRSDSPWYPEALRLFRQKQADEWAGAVADVVTALHELVR